MFKTSPKTKFGDVGESGLNQLPAKKPIRENGSKGSNPFISAYMGAIPKAGRFTCNEDVWVRFPGGPHSCFSNICQL